MLYLLDANVLIDANRDYYPMERVPEFWAWLIHQAEKGTIKMPDIIYGEVKQGTDEVANWLKRGHAGEVLALQEEPDVALVRRVADGAYAVDLTDEEIGEIGSDPFLIACALVEPTGRVVVSTEASKPSRKRANRHVPDVCKDLSIGCMNTFRLIKELDFSTGWNG